jgi:hypothetical protein
MPREGLDDDELLDVAARQTARLSNHPVHSLNREMVRKDLVE